MKVTAQELFHHQRNAEIRIDGQWYKLIEVGLLVERELARIVYDCPSGAECHGYFDESPQWTTTTLNVPYAEQIEYRPKERS